MLKLTNYHSNTDIHIRPDAISAVSANIDRTLIRVDGTWIDVKESVEAVLALMTEATARPS